MPLRARGGSEKKHPPKRAQPEVLLVDGRFIKATSSGVATGED